MARAGAAAGPCAPSTKTAAAAVIRTSAPSSSRMVATSCPKAGPAAG
eukprot:CAMPEP_0170318164 /NCGR_PEP_ID=MMETSP0116_2-20130129/59771_1 /TAXON_ID=400756 /ORGANISM="Durinskia baltica, Strain CSIRO CS-38" /LENGTH=46 /DNA_ID= /DNA_START= /DNA_END= /DNA_ORIENTATION=